jgi:hypothetical protein
MFVGEIGIPRKEFLYELTYCDIILIQKGYDARYRNMWTASRWQTFYLMSAFVGSDGMRKANITSPRDLLPFPWEKETTDISDKEIAELQAQMAAINAELEKENPDTDKEGKENDNHG